MSYSRPYESITLSTVHRADHYIEANFVHPPDWSDVNNNWSDVNNCAKKHILARAGHLLLAPTSVVTSALDTLIGIVAGLGVIAMGGAHYPTYEFATNHLNSTRRILARPYVNLLRALNPDARFSPLGKRRPADHRDIEKLGSSTACITAKGNGFLTSYVYNKLKDVATSCCDSDNLFKRHIASRLTYVLLALSCIVTRVADLIIGIIAAIVSLFTLGKIESINNLAYRALQAPGIIRDLFTCTTRIINPWAGDKFLYKS